MSGIPSPESVAFWSELAALSDLVARTVTRQEAYFAELHAEHLAEPLCLSTVLAELPTLEGDDCPSEGEAMQLLRRVRNRWQCRIIARDITGLADVLTTLQDISRLAEGLIDYAYQVAYRLLAQRHGVPRCVESGNDQQLTLLGMGKLGGRELNFSSDVDLIGVYATPGTTDGRKPITYEEFFRRVIQKLIKLLSEVTPDGFVYRTDFRLRPFGDTGPLVCSTDAFEHYYQVHGREWERYALIKARPVAGDIALGESLLQTIRPFVYRRYLDYSAFASLREMKQLIAEQVKKKGLSQNIKLGRGGIREVEFIAQAYQLIYGGQNPELRTPSLYAVLAVLPAYAELSAAEVKQLRAAYEYLRKVENQLQNWSDQQTQELPDAPEQQQRLATVMECADYAKLLATLNAHRQVVSEQFGRLFFDATADSATSSAERDGLNGFVPQLVSADGFSTLWEGEVDVDAEIADWLSGIGLMGAEQGVAPMVDLLKSRRFRSISAGSQQLLLTSLPGMITQINAQTDNPALSATIFSRILALLQQVCSRSTYLSLLNESPLVRQQIVDIASRSQWLIDYIAAHPSVMDELMGNAEGYTMQSWAEMSTELDRVLRNADDDPERQLDSTRQFKQAQLFQIAVSDVAEQLTLMQVSDQLTQLAEVILCKEVTLAAAEVQMRHGIPINAAGDEAEMAVIAFGKLGGIELGYGSDLDIVFVHDSHEPTALTDGDKPISHSEYFAKLTRKLINRMTAATPIGNLYEIDTRLRPSGNAGVMVTSLAVFADYQREQAWTWEHQALCRARPVVGNERIRERFDDIRASVLTAARDPVELAGKVLEMREKMRAELTPTAATVFHLKHSRGGIVDIEFLVQYWLLAHAHAHPEIVFYSDNIRQIEALSNATIISSEQAAALSTAYLRLREHVHANRLFANHGTTSLATDSGDYQSLAPLIETVAEIWEDVFGSFEDVVS